MSERKIILDSSQRPQTFYKTKDRCAGQFFSCEVNKVLRSVQYIIPVWRENSSKNSISPTKRNRQWFNSTRHSPPDDSELRNSKNIRSAKSRRQREDAFFPIAKNPTKVRAAHLAVLELLKQPEGIYRS